MIKNIFILVGIILLLGSSVNALDVTTCQQITSGGTYVLRNDITDYSGTLYSNACIHINIGPSETVIFDCDGHTIDGVNTANSYGIRVAYANSPYISGSVTLKNCKVFNWEDGINADRANPLTLENITSSYHNGYGLVTTSNHLYDVYAKNIETNYNNGTAAYDGGCRFSYMKGGTLDNVSSSYNQGNGVYIVPSGPFTASNIYAADNMGLDYTAGYGVGLGTNVTISNITSKNNLYGIMIGSNSEDTTVYNSHSSNNSQYGISVGYTTSGIMIYNNFFNNTANHITSSWANFTITKQLGDNIFNPNNPYVQGNFWANSSGGGFSETCTDVDTDGFCDENYTLHAVTSAIDYVPISTGAYNTPPTISSVSPANNSVDVSPDHPLLSATIDDLDGDNVACNISYFYETLKYYVEYESQGVPYDVNLTFDEYLDVGVTYYWGVRCGDGIVQVYEEYQFNVSDPAPTITLVSPTDGQTNISAGTVPLIITVDDDNVNDTVYCEFYNNESDTLLHNETGITTFPSNITFNWADRLVGEHYAWYVTCVDSGGESTTSPVWDFYMRSANDPTDPGDPSLMLSITDPLYTDSSEVTCSGHYHDADGDAGYVDVTIKVDNVVITTCMDMAVNNLGSYSCTETDNSKWSVDQYVVCTVDVEDVSGRTNSGNVSVTVSNRNPGNHTVTLTDPIYTNSTQIDCSFQVSDVDSPDDTLNVTAIMYRDGNTLRTCTAVNQVSGTNITCTNDISDEWWFGTLIQCNVTVTDQFGGSIVYNPAEVNVSNLLPYATIEPKDGEVGISFNPSSILMNITVYDTDNHNITVAHIMNDTLGILQTNTSLSNGTLITYNWTGLINETVYTWHLNLTDGHGTILYNFTFATLSNTSMRISINLTEDGYWPFECSYVDVDCEPTSQNATSCALTLTNMNESGGARGQLRLYPNYVAKFDGIKDYFKLNDTEGVDFDATEDITIMFKIMVEDVNQDGPILWKINQSSAAPLIVKGEDDDDDEAPYNVVTLFVIYLIFLVKSWCHYLSNKKYNRMLVLGVMALLIFALILCIESTMDKMYQAQEVIEVDIQVVTVAACEFNVTSAQIGDIVKISLNVSQLETWNISYFYVNKSGWNATYVYSGNDSKVYWYEINTSYYVGVYSATCYVNDSSQNVTSLMSTNTLNVSIVTTTTTTTTTIPLTTSPGAEGGYKVVLTNGQIVVHFEDDDNDTIQISSPTLVAGEWMDIALVLDQGVNLKLYADTKLHDTVSATDIGDISNVEDLYVGTDKNLTHFLNGSLENVIMYEKELASRDVNRSNNFEKISYYKGRLALTFDCTKTVNESGAIRNYTLDMFGYNSDEMEMFGNVTYVETTTISGNVVPIPYGGYSFFCDVDSDSEGAIVITTNWTNVSSIGYGDDSNIWCWMNVTEPQYIYNVNVSIRIVAS